MNARAWRKKKRGPARATVIISVSDLYRDRTTGAYVYSRHDNRVRASILLLYMFRRYEKASAIEFQLPIYYYRTTYMPVFWFFVFLSDSVFAWEYIYHVWRFVGEAEDE